LIALFRQRYTDRLESLFQQEAFRCKLSRLLPAFTALLENEASPVASLPDVSKSRLDDLARFSVLSMDLAKWLFCNSGSDDIATGFEDVVCLALRATSAAVKCQPLLTKMVTFSAVLS
jgi:hypothetical protein